MYVRSDYGQKTKINQKVHVIFQTYTFDSVSLRV